MAHHLGQYKEEDVLDFAYLRKRLLGRAMVCYGTYLEKYQMDSCHDEMVLLDNTLAKEVPALYHVLDDLSKANPFKKSHEMYEIRYPRSWYVLVWLWRKSNLPKKSLSIFLVVRLKRVLKK